MAPPFALGVERACLGVERALGWDKDELTGGAGVATEDAAADEVCVAVWGDFEIEIEVLDGVGEGLQTIVPLHDADGVGALGGEFEFYRCPALAGGCDFAASEAVGALILQ